MNKQREYYRETLRVRSKRLFLGGLSKQEKIFALKCIVFLTLFRNVLQHSRSSARINLSRLANGVCKLDVF